MSLNFSRRPIFPVNQSQHNFVSSMRIRDGIQDKARRFNWEFGDTHDHHTGGGRDRGERVAGSCEPIANDILDLLPSDPFGMNIGATFTAITGWIEDLEMEGLNFIWNSAFKFQTHLGTHERWNAPSTYQGLVDPKGVKAKSCDEGFVSVSHGDDLTSFCDKYSQTCMQSKESVVDMGSCSSGTGGDPHEALLYALGYLGIQELLSVESVCKSLHSAVQNDPLLWRNIHIDQPLSERIDDDILLWLTNRAQGNLHCLSLVECTRVTGDGLKRVLENNPKLTKLSVPGCSRLTIEGIVSSLKVFKSSGAPGLKHLRIGGRHGVTQKHFQELKFLLGADECMQPKSHKPRFYHNGHSSLSFDDDRAIDIEMCPRCENFRLVYDCPAKSCSGKDSSSQTCRACTICIARCDQCGRCINDSEYEETFCLDFLCSDCLKQEEKGSACGVYLLVKCCWEVVGCGFYLSPVPIFSYWKFVQLQNDPSVRAVSMEICQLLVLCTSGLSVLGCRKLTCN